MGFYHSFQLFQNDSLFVSPLTRLNSLLNRGTKVYKKSGQEPQKERSRQKAKIKQISG